jgi:hypothetical protein
MAQDMELQGIGLHGIDGVGQAPDWLRGLIRAVRREAVQPRDERVRSLLESAPRAAVAERGPMGAEPAAPDLVVRLDRAPAPAHDAAPGAGTAASGHLAQAKSIVCRQPGNSAPPFRAARLATCGCASVRRRAPCRCSGVPTGKLPSLGRTQMSRAMSQASDSGEGAGPCPCQAPSGHDPQATALYRTFNGFTPKRMRTVRHSRLMPPVVVQLGELMGLIYRSDKHKPTQPSTSIHFMEVPPTLASNPEGTQLYIVGGNYRVTSRGIEG